MPCKPRRLALGRRERCEEETPTPQVGPLVMEEWEWPLRAGRQAPRPLGGRSMTPPGRLLRAPRAEDAAENDRGTRSRPVEEGGRQRMAPWGPPTEEEEWGPAVLRLSRRGEQLPVRRPPPRGEGGRPPQDPPPHPPLVDAKTPLHGEEGTQLEPCRTGGCT